MADYGTMCEQNVSPGSNLSTDGPHRTPVSVKSEKPRKVPRRSKGNRVSLMTMIGEESLVSSLFFFSLQNRQTAFLDLSLPFLSIDVLTMKNSMNT